MCPQFFLFDAEWHFVWSLLDGHWEYFQFAEGETAIHWRVSDPSHPL